MGYRTLLECPHSGEEVRRLKLADKNLSTGAYDVTIYYSDRLATVNGSVALGTTNYRTIRDESGFSALLGYYVEISGEIYYIPETAVILGFLEMENGTTTAAGVVVDKCERILSPGVRLTSGPEEENSIISSIFTLEANNGDDLNFGSVCAGVMEIKARSAARNLNIGAGTKFTAYKVADDGSKTQIGVYNCQKPEWLGENLYRIVAYDNVSLLDTDITKWFRSLIGWPYSLTTFYSMLCEALGLDWDYSVRSGSSAFNVYQFDIPDGTTGRQLMSWICEAMGSYCVAGAAGQMIATWYASKNEYIKLYKNRDNLEGDGSAEQYYYRGSLTYADFYVKGVGKAQLRADRNSALWPDYSNVVGTDLSNTYVITGNPILMAHPTYLGSSSATDSVRYSLDKLASRFDFKQYKPFRVVIPETPQVRAGWYAMVESDEGVFISPIASVVNQGGKMILSCSCNRTREKADSPEYMSKKEIVEYAKKTAAGAVKDASQEELFRKVAGSTPGFELVDGKIRQTDEFNHTGITVDLAQNSYISSSDTNETNLETWLDGQLSEMKSFSARMVMISTSAIGTSYTFCCTLFKYSANYAALSGFTYASSTIFKRKYGGNWDATTVTLSGSIGGSGGIS